jgi:hypothetical protein
MKNAIVKTFLVLNLSAVSAFMVACAGDSSDPIAEKYPDLKGVEQHDETSDKQVGYQQFPFIITGVEGGSADNTGSFTENKQGQAKIRVYANNLPGKETNVLETVRLEGFPTTESHTIARDRNDPSLFILTWTPTKNFTQAQNSRLVNLQVIAQGKSLATSVSVTEPITLVVSKSGEIPELKETSPKFDRLVRTEGDTLKFEIVIKDPNYYQGAPYPKLMIYPYENTDRAAFFDDASTKVVIDYDHSTRLEGANTFRFFRQISFRDIADFRNRRNQVDPTANSVDVCFLAAAKSITGIESSPRPFCVNVNYLAQEGELVWDSKDPIVVAAGEEKSFGFKITTPNGLSDVKLSAIRDPIVGLSGTKSIEKIENDNTKEVSYIFKWKPACGARNIKKYPIKLEIASTLNGKTRKTPVSFEVEAINSETNCAPKTAPAK